ncbi:MAG: cupin domain-containing protein [Phormidesmis sp.]
MSFASVNAQLGNSTATDMPELESLPDASGLANSKIIDLSDLTTNPNSYDFFTFRPNLEKLILSGAADTEHISILWYTVPNGSVGPHYHSMTESVYTIEGTQTDSKGVYPTGSLYFNPPGSGHEISESTGFFILAYASPPDFANTDLIEDYTPVQINTSDPDLESIYPFENQREGLWVYDVPLDPQGGMSAQFIRSTSSQRYEYQGNYLLVLRGSCNIAGTVFDENMLVVATTVEPQSYEVSGNEDNSCLALGLSFLNSELDTEQVL